MCTSGTTWTCTRPIEAGANVEDALDVLDVSVEGFFRNAIGFRKTGWEFFNKPLLSIIDGACSGIISLDGASRSPRPPLSSFASLLSSVPIIAVRLTRILAN
jgi:hypothetical protein